MASCKTYLIFTAASFLFITFLYDAWISLEKYKEGRISTNVKYQKQHNFQYPSITVCPSPALKRGGFYSSKEGNFMEVKTHYLENMRTLQDVFYFMNQKTWSVDGHQCMTTRISEDPGRPCAFPYERPVSHNETKLEQKCWMPPA